MSAAVMTFNILVCKNGALYVAHCLELDIVCTSDNEKSACSDMVSLITAQIDYAFSNNNLDYLYRPAPASAWEQFYACKKQVELRTKIESAYKKVPNQFVPPEIITRACLSKENSCNA